MHYEEPLDIEIFKAYINKRGRSDNSEVRRMRRALRRLTANSSGWIGK
jgi:hypothetical protein